MLGLCMGVLPHAFVNLSYAATSPSSPSVTSQQQAAATQEVPDTKKKRAKKPSSPPLRYSEISITVFVGGSSEKTTTVIRQRKSDGALVASGKDIRLWGKAVGSKFAQQAQPNRHYSLKQFPKFRHYYETDLRRLYLGSAAELALGIRSKPGGQVVAQKSKHHEARKRCEFLTDGVLNDNKVGYQSALLNVHINGIDLKTAYQFIKRPCGPLLAPILEMRNWRIKVAGKANVLVDDIHWLNLDEFDGIRYEINETTQEIFLRVEPQHFASIELDFAPQYKPITRSAKGGFLNYGLTGTRSSGESSTSFGGLLEVGAFAPLGVVTSNWILSRTGGNSSIDHTRLKTQFVKDFALDTKRLTLGDVDGEAGAWGIGYRMGGIQFGTNFGTQPGSQISPVESLAILADQPTILRVINRQVDPLTDENSSAGVYYNHQQTLPYGPLEVYNLPTFSNGIYTLQGVTADGSTVSSSQNYYYNQGLLKQGLHDYSVELGLIRQGGFSDTYNVPIFTATERYGINRYLTAEGRIEYGDDVVSYGLNLATVVPWAGVLTTTLAQGHAVKGSTGSKGFQSIRLSNRYRRLNYNLNFRHFDRRFIHPGESKSKINNQRHTYAAGVSSRLPWNDTITLGYSAASTRNARFSDSASIGYTLNSIGAASATLLYRQELHQNDNWVAVASVSINLDAISRGLGLGGRRAADSQRLFTPQNSNLSISANKNNSSDLNSTFRLSTSASEDLTSYGVGLRGPLIGKSPYVLDGNYSNRYFISNASITDFDGRQAYSASIAGGIGFIGGGAYFSQPLTDAFGLVDLGEDAANVRVNGVRTNKRGRALIPSLQAYFDNRVAVNLQDLPLSAQVDEIASIVRPHFRSGIHIRQDIPYETDMLVQVVLEHNGEKVALPFAAEVRLDDIEEAFPVGNDGYVYLVGVGENSSIEVNYRNQKCVIAVPFPEELEPDEIPELGPFLCEGVKL